MTLNSKPVRILGMLLLPVLITVTAYPQGAGARRTPAQPGQGQQAPAQQVVQPFAIGDAVEIQAADGSWIAGSIRSFDPATGKFEVVLVNSMSGWAAPSALRRQATGSSQAAASPAGQSAAATAQSPAAQPGQATGASVCGTDPKCYEVRNFGATVTDFRLSSQGNDRLVDATVRFINKTGDPLALGYVDASADIIDDRGNRFTVKSDDTIRGIGVIKGDAVDAKFILQPGESGDTQFQLVFNRSQKGTLGTSFELHLTVRALNSVGADQYRPGAEYPVHLAGLGQTPASISSASPGGKTQQAGAQANAAPSGQSKSSGIFSGLSQAATSIPGFGKTPAGAKTATTAQAATAPAQSAQTGGVSNAVQAGNNLIPAFGGGPAASGVASTASALIPGFSATPAGNSPAAAAATATAPVPAARAATPVPAPVATAVPVPAAAVAAPTDPCANKPHCFNAGSFAADITQIVGGQTPKGYTIRTQVIFRNESTQTVVLGYVPNSASAADNLGNRFATVMDGAVEDGVTGMTAVNAAQGARFILGPRQQRAVALTLVRPVTVSSTVGAEFNLSFQVGELSAPTGPATLLRQQPLSFANIACQACAAVPAAANSAGNALKNAITKKK
jgi:hypothetical protein